MSEVNRALMQRAVSWQSDRLCSKEPASVGDGNSLLYHILNLINYFLGGRHDAKFININQPSLMLNY